MKTDTEEVMCAAGVEPCACAVAALKYSAKLEQDAKRYQFLRSRDLDTVNVGGVFVGMTPMNVVLNGEDLDRAVDDAMRSNKI